MCNTMKRIALDTGVARELCYKEPSWFSAFEEMVKDGWSFHLTDVCIGEILAARERKAITDKQWAKGVKRLERLLSEYFPCLPGKRDLFHLCGFRDDEDPDKEIHSEEYLINYSRAVWETLRKPMFAKGRSTAITFMVGGTKMVCPIQPENATQVIEEERAGWIEMMTRNPTPDFNYAKDIMEKKAHFDSWAKTDGLPMSVRGDILAHVEVEWERRLASGYNPSSPKRRNDGMDFLLNYTFLWPALLVTTDKNYRDFLRGLESYQSGWIYLPIELADAWKARTLESPSWPIEKN